jgi:hypothetical protein
MTSRDTAADDDAPPPDAATATTQAPPAPDRANARAARRAFLGRWGVPLASLVAALVVTARTHAFFMVPYATPVSNDEGYLAAMALRMFRGHWLPYVDGVSQRGPILYYLTAITLKLGGTWNWMAMRVLGLLLASAEVGLTFLLAATLFSPMAGAVASLVLAYFLAYELNPWDGVGVNGEPLAVCFALGAAILVAQLQLRDPPRRGPRLFWAGLLTACAGLSKQMFLVHGLPLGLWLLLGPRNTRAISWRERTRELGVFGAGFAVPYALVVGLYAATGHLGTFVYYYQRYGRDIFMDPVTFEFVRDKVREQIDKYYMGIVAVGMVAFYALARALRQTLVTPVAGAVPVSGEQPRHAPETYALLNVLLPGLGLALLPRRRVWGGAAFVTALAVVGARVAMRQVRGVGHPPAAQIRDALAYLAVGAVAAVVTAVLVRRDYPEARWNGLERVRANAVPWYALLHMLCAFAGACFTFRFFPHYFVQFFPFAAVVVGGVVAASYATLDADDRPGLASALTLATGAVILLAIGSSALGRNVRLRRETDRWYQDPQADPIVRYVVERTRPDQTIFVWGFRAETYLSARRWPSSRYVYTVYPAGVVPWFQATHEEEERRVVPGSREELLADLEREQPELVVDAGRSMNGRYMYNYPVLRSYLDRKYCFMRYVDGEPVYRRRHGERCPPADY